MNAEWPKQQAALAAAVAERDVEQLQAVIRESVKAWDEWGAWPDDWAAFQRALDDVLPWNQGALLEDVAYGRVDITKGANRG